MKVRYSRRALAELAAILSTVAEKNPAAAARLEMRIRQIEDRLRLFPEGFQEVQQRPGVRRAPLIRFPYLVFHKMVSDEVVVLRVTHGARKEPWEQL